MEALAATVLSVLDANGTIDDTRSLPVPGTSRKATSQEDQLAIQGALNSLQSREMITYTTHDEVVHELTGEGQDIVQNGSHEARVWAALPVEGEAPALTAIELRNLVGEQSVKIGQGRAMKAGWIGKDGNGFVRIAKEIEDATVAELMTVASTGTHPGGEKALADLRKRNLAAKRKLLWFTVSKGTAFSATVEKLETDLTADMLASGAWKTAKFKKYNFEAEGLPPSGGAFHPLLKVREEIRNIFFEMGFAEMPTSSYVESAFWNFDSLFVPQQHPAREMQDTFYVSDPPESLPPPESYRADVARVHSEGDYGSLGYRAPWSDEETRKLVLRTHTTASSASMLRQIGEEFQKTGNFKAAKLFSIDRVFRNEAVDMTHLAEFHQVEGVVADRNLTLGDLIGFMQTFFNKMGITQLRFKPAYNPYTEPSMEIFAFHPQLNRWVEIGNSGMFRPEMLEPMGLPKDVRVHGWGLSLERPTMIRYGISNIRTLVGHKVPIESVEKAPAVRF
ncbi:tRNA synthetases class II core domain (F)-domain-containing protein [Auriculariales sp. MPI-PUGE-AT-0066]|nr:tRNA synthetases class II core domain (F)-domain-containing protein [Auriculariales sp. MPI-PUGE-AT-0066]